MFFNPSLFLLGIAGLTAALPVPAQDASSVVTRGAHQLAGEAQMLAKRSEQVVNQIVQEEVVVYVDAAGRVLSTSTVPAVPVSAPTTTSVPAPVPQPTKHQQNVVSVPSSTSAAAPAPSSNGPLGAASLTGAPFSKGVTYSPKIGSGACKSAADVATDINFLIGQGHDLIRLYGVECNGISSLKAAVKGKPVWMFLGIFDVNQAGSEAAQMNTQLAGDWSQVHTVAVGNEFVQGGGSVGAVIGAISAVRSQLRGLGYNGPVVTVDTAVIVESNPVLCQKSDYCAVNCHAFWDANPPSQADNTITFHVNALKQKTGMDKVVITESGWPTCGTGNGAATASKASQDAAISSLKSVPGVDIILFSSFNDHWKQNFAGSFAAEQCWGLYGDAPTGS